MTKKECNRCKTIKALDEFRDQPRGKFGKRSKCKKCEYELFKEYYSTNPQKKRDTENKYRKNNPEVFARKNKKYYLKNKDKMFEANKLWKENNPEQRKALGRKSQNIRRARKLGNGQEPYTEQQVLETYGTSCHLCLLPIDMQASRKVGEQGWENGLHLDHVVPLSKGGPDTLENVKPSHGICNIKKSSMS